jgi:hypothetical protein
MMIEKLQKVDDDEYPYIDENGGSWQSKTDYIQIEILHFCGCGDPDEVMMYVAEFLIKISKEDFGDYEDMSYMFLSYWADNEGFIDHGTTVRCSWLTDKGKELLNDINWRLENEINKEG